MKTTKKIIIISILLVPIMVLNGCWNYREINDIAIVSSLAIDRDETGDGYIVTIEIIKPEMGLRGGDITTMIYECRGATVFDAVRNLIVRSGKRGFWSHAKAVVISKDIAEKDIAPVLDWLYRDSELRRDIQVYISKGNTAKEIIRSSPELDESVGFNLDSAGRFEKNSGKYPKTVLADIIRTFSEEERGIIIPLAVPYKKEKNGEAYDTKGSAVLKKYKVVGYLNEDETQDVLCVQGKLKTGLFIVKNIAESGNDITLEVFNNKTKKKTRDSESNNVVEVNIKSDVGIAEISGGLDFTDKNVLSKIKADAEHKLKDRIEHTIRKTIEDYNTDVFNFGTTIRIYEPKLWKTVGREWEREPSKIHSKVNVYIHIRGSGVASKPIKGGD